MNSTFAIYFDKCIVDFKVAKRINLNVPKQMITT